MSPSLHRRLPLLATGVIFVVLFVAAGFCYDSFFSIRVAVNLLTDNATLGLTAVGMTLVIFSGGIDLSVGALAGFTSIFVATLVEGHHVHPAVAAAAALLVGGAVGAGMGALIHFFRQPPFLITLAGMFLLRGCAFWLNTESVGITHPLFERLAGDVFDLGGGRALPVTALVLVAGLAVGGLLGHYTRFGRNLLAIGGNEQSALLMGLPLGATKIGVYTVNSLFATLAGLVGTVYTGSGNPSFGIGLELDAIAVVVIGGTLLTGGRGHVLGTLFGLLIFGTIQSALLFDGRLSPWWSRIVVGALLLAFILLQRGLVRRLARPGNR
jgi:simple sugar transport system permease protein